MVKRSAHDPSKASTLVAKWLSDDDACSEALFAELSQDMGSELIQKISLFPQQLAHEGEGAVLSTTHWLSRIEDLVSRARHKQSREGWSKFAQLCVDRPKLGHKWANSPNAGLLPPFIGNEGNSTVAFLRDQISE